MREGRLGYNSSNGRYGILSSDLWIDTGLHCGECLQILMDGKWVQTRMEKVFAPLRSVQSRRPPDVLHPGRAQGYF